MDIEQAIHILRQHHNEYDHADLASEAFKLVEEKFTTTESARVPCPHYKYQQINGGEWDENLCTHPCADDWAQHHCSDVVPNKFFKGDKMTLREEFVNSIDSSNYSEMFMKDNNNDYIKWLEEKVKKLTTHNSAMVQFTAEQLYSAAKDAGLHNADIDDLISVIGKQHQ